jgi:hypothetical protein
LSFFFVCFPKYHTTFEIFIVYSINYQTTITYLLLVELWTGTYSEFIIEEVKVCRRH